MVRVMLDTNVLVKLVFVLNKIYINKKIPKNLRNYEIILKKLENSKFVNVMSNWNRFELRDVLMRLKLAETYFLSGFSVDEFRDAKDEKIKIPNKNIKSVNNLVIDIWNFCEKSTALDMNMVDIEKWNKKDYSTMDLILLNQAKLHNCDYFVTNDKKLFESEELKKHFKLKICKVKEFIGKI